MQKAFVRTSNGHAEALLLLEGIRCAACVWRDADEVWLGGESGLLAVMRFGDELRSEVPQALAELARLGLNLHLVTGDGAAQATRLARQLGIDRVSARALPQDKVDYVSTLQQQGAVVAVVDNGVNDAPVLARADLSIAMGDGTRLAQLQADAILGSGNVADLAWSVSVLLVAMPDGSFEGRLRQIGSGPWRAILDDERSGWRLSGEWPAGRERFELSAAS